PEEYELARYIASISENISKLSIPEDELGYLAYYINKFCIKDDKVKENVKVLIVTHGKVGIEMANVVNNLMGVECTIGLEIPLESSSSRIEKCISQISSINAPNGLIILIDMGSLVIIGNEVERFKIKKTRLYLG
ncbi:MAG: PTS sugar transporter, partial [Peptostreptococcus anaerobius]